MKIDITFLNYEQCQVMLSETPRDGVLVVCQTDASGAEVVLGRFPLTGAALPIAIPIGTERSEELERLVFHEYNGDTQRAVAHRLNLAATLLARQALQAGVYRARPSTVKRVAALTIAYNEDFVLPKWVDYYGRQFGLENLYVIDDGSDRDPRTYLPAAVNVIRQPRTSFDSWRLSRSLGIFQHFLLETYDLVVVTDSDEFIVPTRSAYSSLADYVTRLSVDTPRRLIPTGWDLVHLRGSDAAIDLSQPIVGQRRALLRNTALDKVAILSDHVSFTPGQHQCYERSEKADDLTLIHLRYFDYEFSREKLQRYRTTTWAANDLSAGLSYHQRQEFSALEQEFQRFEDRYQGGGQETNVLNDFWRAQLSV
ncbi:glycosyltransferase family 2 protein [Methylomonas sp. UP202]|uniref:glycosyltransferase family 2 protein n=1 Tax=Methylomonas sp. UP202 TaxID=3040943 RepID=UPI00247A0DA8|nr:glycosyltransferase family 2 protein [Methylomonas sp. UP202]WGS86893.1 glycosyltransferase family 2 protein [Methylomonas sp. UP202]